jgi:hypothetical protein
MREVDQLQDAVDERVAQRDERVDTAVRQPDEADVEELARIIDQVRPEPEDDQPDEAEPDPAGDGFRQVTGEVSDRRPALAAGRILRRARVSLKRTREGWKALPRSFSH